MYNDDLITARANAVELNVTLPTDDTELQRWLTVASKHIDTYAKRFKGKPITRDKQFPRTDLYIDGFLVLDVPCEVKYAEVVFASHFANDVAINKNEGNKLSSVDVINYKTYSANEYITQAMQYLSAVIRGLECQRI